MKKYLQRGLNLSPHFPYPHKPTYRPLIHKMWIKIRFLNPSLRRQELAGCEDDYTIFCCCCKYFMNTGFSALKMEICVLPSLNGSEKNSVAKSNILNPYYKYYSVPTQENLKLTNESSSNNIIVFFKTQYEHINQDNRCMSVGYYILLVLDDLILPIRAGCICPSPHYERGRAGNRLFT